MKKIDLFLIIAFKEQTFSFFEKIRYMRSLEKQGKMDLRTNLENHYFILDHHFNIYNFFEYKDKISTFEYPVIYHLPYGLDIDKNIETILEKFKGKIPIIMRSYDPHSPIKCLKDYMMKYHDLVLTYFNSQVDETHNIIFSDLCFDTNFFYKNEKSTVSSKKVCFIGSNRDSIYYNINKNEFDSKGMKLEKMYKYRAKLLQKTKEIDVFGKNWPLKMTNYKGKLNPFDQKFSTMENYNFILVVENAQVNSYISEKILDAFCSLTIPIYLGPAKVKEYFPEQIFINIANFSSFEDVLHHIDKLTDEEILLKKKLIQKYRDEIFLKFYTKNSFTEKVYSWYRKNYSSHVNISEEEYENIENNISKLKVNRSNYFISEIKRIALLYFQKIKNYFQTYLKVIDI